MNKLIPLVVAGLLLAPGAAVVSVATMAMAGADPASSCGPGGSSQQIGNVDLSGEQLANAQTIASTVAAAGAPKYAAVVALATAMQESTLHNSSAQTDHDSEGLFQQRVSVYTAQVASDPARSTRAFLERLLGVPNWQTIPLTEAASSVQIPRVDLRGAYAAWQGLAQTLADRFWTGSSTGAVDVDASRSPGTGPTSLPCPTSADAGGAAVSGAGIPAGYTLPSDPTLSEVVGYALAQLGKPYVYAAEGPDSFDCSGLVLAAWSQVGLALPRTTYFQVTVGTPVPTPSLMTPGDLIFIPGSDGTFEHPGHVGMYIGAVAGVQYLVNAPQTGDVVKVAKVTSWGELAAIRHPTTPGAA